MHNLKALKPKKALNKAFLKAKPTRIEIENFKTNLLTLLNGLNETESEEFHKNLLSDFLKDTYYKQQHFINTKGRNDLVIHNENKAKSTVGIIIEAKKPSNKAEMLSPNNINKKALQELLLYYLRERITQNNLEIKHLIATNFNEWFIFDANLFERSFAQNKNLVKQFKDFEAKRLADTKTEFFYKQIAEPFIASLSTEIEFTYFNLQDYQQALRQSDKAEDNSLIPLFKIFSPEHLLKRPFSNDSNQLDKSFYSELLHIIGLSETKEGGKKLIQRNKLGERHTASLLEETIIQLDSLDKISYLKKPSQFGTNKTERLFNVALELSITWINRILFLKLLEAQLLRYHKGDKNYSFLNIQKLKTYGDLNTLFFQVLARRPELRNEDVKKAFEKLPYLNSSLFEPTSLESEAIFLSNLNSSKTLALFPQTVLKDQGGKKRSGSLGTLQYLFEFLDAYDFGAEGSSEIQEDNKTLINASVLGLIFEKINGYKDGSFFTPGFITMYMCRETIRKAVVQQFNQAKQWNCTGLEELYDKIEDRKEANELINQLKICDPAVGSGHFLVSALNEIIALKNDLKILQDRKGKRLKEYQVEVVNDELIITDEDGELFEYNPNNKESQRIQETLFHEKQTIIENCLFGVDINPNSVKICRLRLWIELLKNAYYKNPNELETLPNIDINIKSGNALVSRFPLEANLGQALKKNKWTIEDYQTAVATYRNAENKEQKRQMEQLIADIKTDFRSEISKNDPKLHKKRKLEGELFILQNQTSAFGQTDKQKKEENKKIEKLKQEIQNLETEIEAIKSNQIFENAFEWRFEFPEVLNDEGDFVGFDVLIGNPPYISNKEIPSEAKEIYKQHFQVGKEQFDLYALFMELAIRLSKNLGLNALIVPDSFLGRTSFKELRRMLKEETSLTHIFHADHIFDEASVSSCIYFLSKSRSTNQAIRYLKTPSIERYLQGEFGQKMVYFMTDEHINSYRILFLDEKDLSIVRKFYKANSFNENIEIWRGEEIGKKSELLSQHQEKDSYLIVSGENIKKYQLKAPFSFVSKKDIKKDLKKYQQEKIMIKQLGNDLCAVLDKKACISVQSVYNLYSTNPLYKNELLLALLNSKLFNFIYQSVYGDKQQFPRILIENIKMFCLPNLNQDLFLELEQIMVELLNLKQTSPLADSQELENQIDHLVYQLYGLSEEEVQMIERN